MAQFARPTGDLDNTGSWTPDVGPALWEDLDDGASADGNTVVSDSSPTTSEPFTVDLGTITDPTISTGHILRIRWAKNSGGGGSKTIRIELREGYVNESTQGTLIATDDYSLNSTTLQNDETALSGAEADNIGDYSDLQIRVMGVSSNRALQVDFVELETPDEIIFVDGDGVGHAAASGTATGEAGPPAWIVYRPISDEDAGSWTTTPLWSKVDDDPTDSGADSDVITASSGTFAVLELPTLVAPPTYISWRIRVRARNTTGGTRSLSVFLLRQSDSAFLSNSPGNIETPDLTSSFKWFDVILYPTTAVSDWLDVALSDFAIAVNASGTGTGDIEVSAVELRIPDPYQGALGTPGLADIDLLPRGRSGPFAASDGKRWLVGLDATTKLLWAFSSTDPTDGHNPGEWDRELPLAELPAGVAVEVEAGASERRTIDAADALLDAAGDLIAIGWAEPVAPSPFSTVHSISLGATPAHTRALAGPVGAGVPGAANDLVLMVERTDFVDAFKVVHDNDIGNLTFNQIIADTGSSLNLTGDPHTLFDLIAAANRVHAFYGKTDADLTQGIRQRAWNSSTDLETEPGSDTTTEDMARTGRGAAYDSGGTWRVVAPFPQADGGGITAITFDSADAPTETLEVVSTRDAFDAAYEQSVIAVPVGITMVVVWIDDAADAIWAASRADGGSSWVDQGEQVAGSAGRTRMSAQLVEASTIGVVVAATTGNIFYYEFRLVFGGGIGHGVSSGTAIATVVEAQAEAAGHAIAHGQAIGSVVGVVTATALGHATPSGTVSTLGSLIDAIAAGHVVSSGLATGDSIGDIDATAISHAITHSQVVVSIAGSGTIFTGWGIPAHVS